MNDQRFLRYGIPVVAALELLPRHEIQRPFGVRWLAAYAVSLVFTVVLWLGARYLWQRSLRRWATPAGTGRRLWWLAAGAISYTLLMTLVLGSSVTALLGGPSGLANWLRESSLNLVSVLIVVLVYESTHFFEQWESNQRRADQLARAQTQAQLDALAQQLDPHFLFNSLNTLAALIDPADEAAQHYVEGLADVYRYVLVSRERPTVPLAEELAFVQTYVALQQVRFRDNVQVSYDVPAAALARRVAPLSVQVLVENALKHNEASQARPLHLRLVATPDTLRVENTYQPRPAGLATSLGTGLANVRQRYALLGAAYPIEVLATSTTFTVALPLLPAS